MKNYFAKYLTVEGSVIPYGSLFMNFKNPTPVPYKQDMFKQGIPVTENEKQVKLFLCSRNVKAGDTLKECLKDGVARVVDHFEAVLPFGIIEFTDGEYISCIDAFKVVGEISAEATWVKEDDEFEENETSYDSDKTTLIEKLRKDFEQKTGLSLGSWVKDSEDGYKTRYQGTIYNYTENGGELQIHYGCIGTFGGCSWGWEKDIIPMNEGNGLEAAPITYQKPVIKILNNSCKHFH